MSVKLKISYNTEEELAGVIQQLFPLVKSWKISRTQKGRYRNAYMEIDSEKLMYFIQKEVEHRSNSGKCRK